jgi:iron complex transport system substrate-binding protein
MLGRNVALSETVSTVVALSPSAAEFAAALGLQVIGRSSDTPQSEAPSASAVGPAISPDFAAVAALRPDLVIADAAYHAGRTRDFDRFAIPVFAIKANTFGDVLGSVDALGEASGLVDAAGKLRASITAEASGAVELAKQRAANRPAPKVLILTGGGRDVFSGSESSYLGDLVKLLGGANVLATATEGGPVPGFGVVDVNQAASLNSDVVFILSSGEGGLAERIRTQPQWASTPAVKSGRIHEVDTMRYLRAPGPGVAEAMEALVGLLWP